MSKYLTGTIVLVKFHPGYGAEFAKYRPAVIVSQKIEEIDSRFVLIAPLTKDLKQFQPNCELLLESYQSLNKDSVLLCWYLRTIDIKRVVGVLGNLRKSDLKMMQEKTIHALQ